MKSKDIREKFLSFFRERGHAIVKSSSLIPDDPSVLLTTAGMQQFKPYFIGKADPVKDFGTKNTASIQKCFRTSDIDEVGDESHLTFFEMLGNFSFGGYFKRETIEWTYQLLTEVFNIAPDRISASVFVGDKDIPFDQESYEAWSRFLPASRVRKGPREDNVWGPAGSEGPCGASNEVYVDGLEVATLVFMEYYCHQDRSLTLLPQKGVDVGWGLERLAMVVQQKLTIFETDLFAQVMSSIPTGVPEGIKRVVADHARGVTFLLADGIRPSNKETGYVLRRLLRRIFTYEYLLRFPDRAVENLLKLVAENYGAAYPELVRERENSLQTVRVEHEKFGALLAKGVARVKQLIQQKKNSSESKFAGRHRPDFGSRSEDILNAISGYEAFDLYQSYGFPPEVIEALLAFEGYTYHKGEFKEAFQAAQKKHQEISRAGQEKKFGGHGLILDTGELKAGDEAELKKVTRLHTATHLLQQALRDVLGDEVRQMGSDITPERTRFDFTFPRKLTPEEIAQIEAIVNAKIKEDLPVSFKELPKEEAEKTGALHFFSARGGSAFGGKEKYPERVKVYYVGKSLESAWSKEFCGGPHVTHTGEIGRFKIAKEEAVGAGVRRIRGVVE